MSEINLNLRVRKLKVELQKLCLLQFITTFYVVFAVVFTGCVLVTFLS